MSGSDVNAFFPDALAANRRGELSDSQRQGFGALAASNHRSNYGSAALFAAAAVLIGFFASPSASPGLRLLLTTIAGGLAIVLVFRALTGSDALTRDVRAGRVESVEGAVGKRRISARGGPSATVRFLDVGTQHFRVSRRTFEDAPDAGFVRVFFLPRSRKVVNLERLAHPVPDDLNVQHLRESVSATFRASERVQRNEARAELASVTDAWEASTAAAAPPPATARDARPLAQAILGAWTNGVMDLTFVADGSVTTSILGTKQNGRWSVDRDGRLSADVAGRRGTVDAWVAGDQLTINLDGSGMTFSRARR
jgi:hypothetical protein